MDPKEVSSQLATFNAANRDGGSGGARSRKVPYVVYPNAGSVRDWDAVNKCWWVQIS